MRYLYVFILLQLVFTSCQQNSTQQETDNQLAYLLENENYFKLKELLSDNNKNISKSRLLYYQAFLSRAFGNSKESNKNVTELLNNYTEKLNDTSISKLLELKAENHIMQYQYKDAANLYDQILEKYVSLIDSIDIPEYENARNIFRTLSEIEPQSINKSELVKISSFKNQFNHLMVPVKINDKSENFVFDTGANLSVISESEATKMNLKIFESDVEIGTITEIKVQSKLAVADSLYVGDLVFKNVVFMVMPDEELSFPQIDYYIKGIIGFPLMYQMGEIQFHRDGSIIVSDGTDTKNEIEPINNMFLSGLNPVIKAFAKNDTLVFNLDTGAITSELSYKYFKENETEVKKNGHLIKSQRAGAGGAVAVEEYLINDFSMRIGTHDFTLPRITIPLKDYDYNKYFDGNLGQDILTQYDVFLINFKGMYIDFK
jgi:predicted aspartyl protease